MLHPAPWVPRHLSADVGCALDRLLADLEIEHGRLAIDVARCHARRQLVMAANLATIQHRVAELLEKGRKWRRKAISARSSVAA